MPLPQLADFLQSTGYDKWVMIEIDWAALAGYLRSNAIDEAGWTESIAAGLVRDTLRHDIALLISHLHNRLIHTAQILVLDRPRNRARRKRGLWFLGLDCQKLLCRQNAQQGHRSEQQTNQTAWV